VTGTVRALPWPTRLAAGSAVLVTGLGLAVLAGWLARAPALIQVLPHLPPMTRNTAACFVLCGLALLARALGGPLRVVAACAGAACAVGAVTFAEIALGVDAGIDEILGTSYINVGLPGRGRMAPGTALCFALAGTGLLLARGSLSRRSAFLLGLNGSVIVAFGSAAALGFWSGVSLAALHTAAGLWVLGLGLLALAWHVEGDPAGTPPWLPISVAIGVVAGTAGLWRALVLGGYATFGLLPAAVVAGGCLVAPVFGLTVYLAQRAHAQAAALRRSEAFLAEAQHLSRTGSFSWRVAADDVEYSEETYRMYGFDPGRPVTLAMIATRIHPDDMPLLGEMIGRARGPGSDLDYEYRLRMPDGSVKHLHLVAHATRDAEGGLEYIGAIQDVTQRRLSEEALGKVRSELAHVARVTTLGALTASIAHEVNQPLSGIITNAGTCLRMLAADPPNVEGALETARRTIRDGHRAADVITRGGLRSAGRGQALRGVLHDQAGRHGDRPFAEPLHRREPRWPPVGGGERRPGSHVLLFRSPPVRSGIGCVPTPRYDGRAPSDGVSSVTCTVTKGTQWTTGSAAPAREPDGKLPAPCVPSFPSSTTTSPCASRSPTCSGSSASRCRRSRPRRSSSRPAAWTRPGA
jgi:PAS domain S-box-containing protein